MDKIQRIFAFVGFVLGLGLAIFKNRQLERVSEQKAQQEYGISNRT